MAEVTQGQIDSLAGQLERLSEHVADQIVQLSNHIDRLAEELRSDDRAQGYRLDSIESDVRSLQSSLSDLQHRVSYG